MNTPSASDRPVSTQAMGLPGLMSALPPVLPLIVLVPLLLGSRPRRRPARPASGSGDAPLPGAADTKAESFAGPPARPVPLPITQRFPAHVPPGPEAAETDAHFGEPVILDDARPSRPSGRRGGIPPMDILGFLSDAAPYIPGMDHRPISRMMQARDIAGRIRSLRDQSDASVLSAAPARPVSELPLGFINALRRNMQGNVPPNLGRAEQIMNLIGTLRGGSGNLLQTMGNFMQNNRPYETTGGVVPQPPAAGDSDAESRIGSALSNALSSMDDSKRQQLVKMAQDVINKMK